MIDRIDDTIKMEDLPTWLQELWEKEPYIARRAEKRYLELTNKVNHICSCTPNTDIYCVSVIKCNKCNKEVDIIRANG